MTPPVYRVRRATLDDLPALRELWQKMALPLADLEKRFTEVQIAETPEGQIAGAIGLKIERLHGQIHSEAIANPTDTALYGTFWQRLQILARNHGLFRLWTESKNPYWPTLGFKAPDEKILEKAPAGIVAAKENLLTLALKEETAEGISVEKQFEMFTQAQKAETQRLMEQAQVFKKLAYLLLGIAIFGLLAAAAYRFLIYPRRPRKP